MERELILDYWNNFRHFDDGIKIFLLAKNINRDEFDRMYYRCVNISNNPWKEDTFKV